MRHWAITPNGDSYMNPALIEAIEALVDQHGLTQVLVALSEVCSEKAEHLRVNWQDKANAGYWDQDAKRIGHAAAAVNN
jgi:hypothetical protein